MVAADPGNRMAIQQAMAVNQALRDTNQAISNNLQASISLKDAVAEMRRGGRNTQDIGDNQSVARHE